MEHCEGSSFVVVLLSGPLAVGKTSVRDCLERGYEFRSIRSSDYLRQRQAAYSAASEISRTSLQDIGDALDKSTDFAWIVNDVAIPTIRTSPNWSRWLVDAVRKRRQVEHFRAGLGVAVRHVHLVASETTLRARYEMRAQRSDVVVPYDQAITHSNEQASRALWEIADVLIDVEGLSPHQIAERIALRVL